MPLMKPRSAYRPFEYQFAFDAYLEQQQAHWLPTEVSMSDDIKDFHRLPEAEKNLLVQVLRFFVQGDIEVANNYQTRLMPVFQVPEVQMMLSSFAASEAIHVHAYSYLIDSLGMPETEYTAFLEYQSMREKYEYLHGYKSTSHDDLARTLAVFGAFMEGTALFASFAILLNFQRNKKMNGLGQIIAWSARDESIHALNICRLYRAFIDEHPEVNTAEHRHQIQVACEEVISLEDHFIDTCFALGPVPGLTAEEVKAYIRYVANIRMGHLGLPPAFDGNRDNPIPWVEEALSGREHVNFFEQRATEYAKAVLSDDWPE